MYSRLLARRAGPAFRRFSTEAPTTHKSPYIAELEAVEHHAHETTDLWRKISFYVCIPAIAVCSAWVWNIEAEHKAHSEHLKHENDGVMPQPPAYEYLNVRRKPYPWGPNSLFFNHEVQKDMAEA
ncbi:mitochondrial cytochrome c oxidase subunit VIa [Dendrothele bispora CBS 962.96]|uniref:Mitochondrial cytochrome c oxidase subunit VIa n=1 Tax=Dendrothele bispora (strain CBS 962.96) TaxID=1314807 RepID=A0A4S8MWH3_DENBC|nr:mitochondrial cytochrome c oxidase subunit VIa [Dendrothele bispora CBS 962.96]